MKYQVLVALLGVNKALKVAEEATQSATNSSTTAAGVKCPAGFSEGNSPGYCMPNNLKTCPENTFLLGGSCLVLCEKGFINGATYGECVPDLCPAKWGKTWTVGPDASKHNCISNKVKYTVC